MILTLSDLFILILFIWVQGTLATGLSLVHMIKEPKAWWVLTIFWLITFLTWPYVLITNFFDIIKSKLP